MQRIFAIVMVAGLSACGSAEEKLAGRWKSAEGNYVNHIDLHSDGTFVAHLEQRMFANSVLSLGDYAGTWRIKENHLNGVVTQSSVQMLSVGYTWSDEVTDVAGDTIVFQQATGHQETWTRE